MINYSDNMRNLEAILFAWGDSITFSKISEIMHMEVAEVKALATELNEYYIKSDSAFEVVFVNQSVQLMISNFDEDIIAPLFENDSTGVLSKSTLEVLAIIAYNQNIPKAQIEYIRGVSSDRAINLLLKDGLIKSSYNKEINTRSKLYSTTEGFLKKFGLKNLKELPSVDNLEKMQLSLDDMNIK